MSLNPIAINALFTDLQKESVFEGLQTDQRRNVNAYALAVVVARQLSIPTAPVDSSFAYFNNNHAEAVRQQIGMVNERLVLDTEVAKNFAYVLWAQRYQAMHPPMVFQTISPYGFFDTLFGIGIVVDEKTNTFLNENKTTILTIAQRLTDILAQINSPAA